MSVFNFKRLLGIGAICVVGAMPMQAAQAAPQHVFTLGSVGAPTAPESAGLRAMADYVKKNSGDRIEIKLELSGALGGEREMLEGVQLGTVDLEFLSTAVIGNFDPGIQILDTPFLYKNLDQAQAVLSGPIGDKLLSKFADYGFVGLALGGNGFRQLTNNARQVSSPSDVKGLKLRTMENPIYVDVWKTLGALPTPMSITEVYSALQQGVVDGQENPVGAIINNRFDEVQKYVSILNYAFNSAAIVMAPSSYGDLSEADQKVVRDGAKLAMKVTFEKVAEIQKTGIQRLEKEGLKVDQTVDVDAFRKQLAPVYDSLYKRFGEADIKAIQDYKQ